MINRRYHMQNTLEDVDPLVVTLKGDVSALLDIATAFRVELCVSEALTNVVRHAASDAQIEIVLSETDDGVTVAIFDPDGAAHFDLRDHAPALENIDPLAECGRGLGLIMQCADAVTYGPDGGRNRLALTFKKVAP